MTPQYPQGHVLYRNLHYSYPLISYGQGPYLYDTQGKQYLDASGGAAVVNVGHGNKEIAEALSHQALKVGYVSGMHFSHDQAEKLALQISEFIPFPGAKIYFLSSGSEAIEAAVKLARQYWVEKNQNKKLHIISRKPSYHGNTLQALALSDREHYKAIFRPMLVENIKIPAPYCYRCFWGEEYPACKLKCAYELEKTISKCGKESISAFITEVIGGASTGGSVPPTEYFHVVRRICDEYEILLIVDEILTGIGRTGKWLASHHFDLSPDIIVMGKGLSSGYFPLSALAVKQYIVDAILQNGKNFLHAQTFSHHPVGCSVGLATLKFLKKNKLVERSPEIGKALMKELLPLLSYPHVGDIRGKGLLLGIEFVTEKKSKKPFGREKEYVEHFLSKALEKGLILWANVGHADGVNGDLILLAPPFIISQKEISQIVKILEEVLSEMEKIYEGGTNG